MLSRRAFLSRIGYTGAALSLPALPGCSDGVGPEFENPALAFSHGVASGDPLHDRVLLWTRVTPASPAASAIPVIWEIALDAAMTHILRRGEARAEPVRDYTVKVDADGLAPLTTYYYRFHARDQVSVTGRAKTTAAPGTPLANLRLGVLSCSSYAVGYFNAFALLAEKDVDLVLHLGDFIYEQFDEGSGATTPEVNRPHDPFAECYTLADYYRRHRQYHTDPDLQRLLQQHPFTAIWDDGDTANGAWTTGAQNHTPETEGDFIARRDAARRAFIDYLPIREHPGDGLRIYRRLQFGDLADLFMLDTRLDGRAQPLGDPASDFVLDGSGDPGSDDPARTLYSQAQRQWLFDGLTASSSRWRMLGNQVMVSHLGLTLPHELGDLLAPLGLVPRNGVYINTDQWDGYAAERSRLFSHLLDQAIQDIVVLTGDIHSSWACALYENPANPLTRRRVGTEFVVTSATSTNFDEALGLPPELAAAFFSAILTPLDWIRFHEVTKNGYMLVDVTRERVQCDWWFLDTVRQPSRNEVHGASWQVAQGSGAMQAVSAPVAGRSTQPDSAPLRP